MESSKRIFVVLSTILFLEASAHSTQPTYNKYPENKQGFLHGPSNIEPTIGSHHSGTSGSGSHHQTNYRNQNLALNSNKYAHGSINNNGLSSDFESTNIGGLNSGYGSTFNTDSSTGFRSGLNTAGLNTGYGSGLNTAGLNTGYGLHHNTAGSNTGYGSGLNTAGLNTGYGSGLNTAGLNTGYGLHHNTAGSNTGYGSGLNTASLNTGYGSGLNSAGLNTGYGSGLNTAGLNTGYGLHHTTAGSNTGYGLPHNSGLNTRHGSNHNIDSNIGFGSNFNAGASGSTLGSKSNSAYDSTIGGSRNIYGSYPNTLNIGLGSNLNDDKSFGSLYPSQLSTASLGQPSSINTQSEYNYNGLLGNPMTTGLYSSQSHLEDNTNAGDVTFKIVHVPLKTGSGSDQTLQLPLTGKAKYKVLHVNPTKTNLPDDVSTTLNQAESGVVKTTDTNESYKIGSYQPNSPQISTSGYENQAAAQVIGSSKQNEDTASIISNNYNYNKNLQDNVQSSLVKADLEFSKIIGDGDNQKGTGSTLVGNQYDSLYITGYQYPGTNKLYNYNQPYTTSNSQSQASATSGIVKPDEVNIYDLNHNKDIIPNNLIATLNQAKLNIDKVLFEKEKVNDNQQGLPQIIPGFSSDTTSSNIEGQYGQNGLQYPATNTLYNNNQPYDNSQETTLSYSNAQANANYGAVKQNEYDLYSNNKRILTNKDLTSLTLAELELKDVLNAVTKGNIEDNQQNVQSTTFASSNSSSTATAGQYSNLPSYNNGPYYPGTNILLPYNQPQDYSNLTPLTSTGNSEAIATASATASSTTQIGQNSQGNYYYPSYSKPTDLTEINQPQTYTPGAQYNAPLSFDDTKKDSEADYGSAKQVTTSTAQSAQVGGGSTNLNGFPFNLGPNRYNNVNNYNLQFENRPNTSFNWQKYLNQPNSILPQSTDSPVDKNVVPNNPTSLGNTQDPTYSQTNHGSNYPIYNVPSSNIAVDTQYSPTYTKEGTTGTDTTKSTATSSSTSEILSIPFSEFNDRPHGYNLYPDRRIHHIYPLAPGHPRYGHQPNIVKAPTTDSFIDVNAVQIDKPILDNIQDINNANNNTSPLKTNDSIQQYSSDTSKGTYQSNDNGNGGTTKTESTATAEAAASNSQTVTTSQQATDNQGLNGQKYGDQHIIQSTDSSVDSSGNERDSTLSSSQTSSDSSNSMNKTPSFNTDDGTSSIQTQSTTDNKDDQILNSGNHHKYSKIHKKHDGNNHHHNQPQTTDSFQNKDSTQTQSSIDDKNGKTQDSIGYVNEDKIYYVDETTITDDSLTVSDTKFKNINDHNKKNQHGGYSHGSNHPRDHHLNRHIYGYGTDHSNSQFPNYSYDQYGTSLHQTNSVNKQKSSQTETSYESNHSTENVSSSDDDAITSTNNNKKISNSYETDDLNNQQITYNSYNNYGNNNAGYYKDKRQKSTTDITTDANDFSYGHSQTTKYSEQSVEIDKTEETDTYNVQYSEDGYVKPTGERSLSSGSSVGSSSMDNSSSTSSLAGSSSAASASSGSSSSGSSSSGSSSSGSSSSGSSSSGSLSPSSSSAGTSSSGNSSSSSSSSNTVIQQQGQSSKSCEPKTPGFSKIGTTLNTKADGTPFSRAFDALLKILDSIEKLFLNKDTTQP